MLERNLQLPNWPEQKQPCGSCQENALASPSHGPDQFVAPNICTPKLDNQFICRGLRAEPQHWLQRVNLTKAGNPPGIILTDFPNTCGGEDQRRLSEETGAQQM
jgi:hypothetical protein